MKMKTMWDQNAITQTPTEYIIDVDAYINNPEYYPDMPAGEILRVEKQHYPDLLVEFAGNDYVVSALRSLLNMIYGELHCDVHHLRGVHIYHRDSQ